MVVAIFELILKKSASSTSNISFWCSMFIASFSDSVILLKISILSILYLKHIKYLLFCLISEAIIIMGLSFVLNIKLFFSKIIEKISLLFFLHKENKI